MRGLAAGAVIAAALALAACASDGGSSERIQEVAVNVLTLQTGTVSELKDKRGTGPFETYEVAPGTMLDVLERAMRKAGPEEDPPYVAVYVSARYGEVLAKEFGEPGKGYADPFRSAALAIVHPIKGEPDRCRVELHAIHRGPFHRGSIAWAGSLPGWIAESLEDRHRIRPIPR